MKGWGGLIMGAVFFGLFATCSASPPVTPPPGTLGFTTETWIEVDGSVTQSERYYWNYHEGVGNFGAVTQETDAAGHAIIVTPGYQEAAAIAYLQEYSAINGKTTLFRQLTLDPLQAPNLSVRTIINFAGDPFAGSSVATHNEEVGLGIISVGGDVIGNNLGTGLLSLCPWATVDSAVNSGYPATTESIAAGSSFRVKNIQGFVSEATVITTQAPFLKYSVDNLAGDGAINAWFVVEIWETTGKWGSHDTGIHAVGQVPTGIFAINDPPGLSSRTSYSESASADGVWRFHKSMSYQSAIFKADPIYQVP